MQNKKFTAPALAVAFTLAAVLPALAVDFTEDPKAPYHKESQLPHQTDTYNGNFFQIVKLANMTVVRFGSRQPNQPTAFYGTYVVKGPQGQFCSAKASPLYNGQGTTEIGTLQLGALYTSISSGAYQPDATYNAADKTHSLNFYCGDSVLNANPDDAFTAAVKAVVDANGVAGLTDDVQNKLVVNYGFDVYRHVQAQLADRYSQGDKPVGLYEYTVEGTARSFPEVSAYHDNGLAAIKAVIEASQPPVDTSGEPNDDLPIAPPADNGDNNAASSAPLDFLADTEGFGTLPSKTQAGAEEFVQVVNFGDGTILTRPGARDGGGDASYFGYFLLQNADGQVCETKGLDDGSDNGLAVLTSDEILNFNKLLNAQGPDVTTFDDGDVSYDCTDDMQTGAKAAFNAELKDYGARKVKTMMKDKDKLQSLLWDYDDFAFRDVERDLIGKYADQAKGVYEIPRTSLHDTYPGLPVDDDHTPATALLKAFTAPAP